MMQPGHERPDGPRLAGGWPTACEEPGTSAGLSAPAAGQAPEKPHVTIGIIPLTDCAPIVVARELGFFEREGLEVTISREGSWSTIRDKVTFGALDAAQMLAPMPIAATIGVSGFEKPMIAAMSLGLNGNAITVSNDLYQRMEAVDPPAMSRRPLSAKPLRKIIDQGESLTFATVFPFSSHHYLLRYWLAASGIDADRDIRLIVIPPPQMAHTLNTGEIDGYCVGEPWNTLAVQRGAGRAVITGHEIWNNAPEKVLGVTRDWAIKHPATHRAMLRALLRAAMWLDDPRHREEAVEVVTGRQYVNVPQAMMTSLLGSFAYGPGEPAAMDDFHVFHRYAATFPWRSHALWFMAQMVRWGQIGAAINLRQVAQEVYRTDLYRAAAADLGLPTPSTDEKPEGVHQGPWSMTAADNGSVALGPDRFCDGRTFDPTRLIEYINQSQLGSRLVDAASMAAANV